MLSRSLQTLGRGNLGPGQGVILRLAIIVRMIYIAMMTNMNLLQALHIQSRAIMQNHDVLCQGVPRHDELPHDVLRQHVPVHEVLVQD